MRRFSARAAWSIAALAAVTSLPIVAGAASITLNAPIHKSVTTAPVVCGAPAAARIVSPWNPEVPTFLRTRDPNGSYGTAGIAVTLDERGNAVETDVFESSGSALLDREALAAARLSRYSPQRNLCSATGGTYLVVVDFD